MVMTQNGARLVEIFQLKGDISQININRLAFVLVHVFRAFQAALRLLELAQAQMKLPRRMIRLPLDFRVRFFDRCVKK